MKPPRVLLFDVFGTLVDWRSSLIEIAGAAGARFGISADWAAVIDDWRRAYQPAMDRSRTGDAWRDLDFLQRETLADVLGRHRIELPPGGAELLVAGWRQLRPWPDSREGLDRLRRKHVTATLSNGHLALLADLLKFADLRVDVVLSAQLAAAYKPAPEVYRTALDLLDCRPQDAAMVAAHPSDLRAAAALGIRPFFVRRLAEWGPAQWGQDTPAAPSAGVQPAASGPGGLDGLIEADGLLDLAEALGC